MSGKTSSKQRVLNAIHRNPIDRVPMNYMANSEIDLALKQHFGLDADNCEGLRQALEIDFRHVAPAYDGPQLHDDIGDIHSDEWGVRTRWVEHGSGGYWDFCDWGLADATLEEVEAWAMPSPDDYDYSCLKAYCEKFKDYFILTGSPGIGDIINSTGRLRSMEQVLIDLVTDDPIGLRLIERKQQIELEIIARTLDTCSGTVDMLWIGEDLGSQISPLISLDTFRKHIRPWLQKYVDLAKSHDIPTMIHSCGSSSWAFNDFIEMGISVVDTLQPEATDMAPQYLKTTYGKHLSFHGSISTAGPLAYGSVQDVIESVNSTLEIMTPGGGYILAPTHSIQSNSPVENVLAMYETAKQFPLSD